MVHKITNNDMQDAKKQAYSVVDFSAGWCGPCNMLAPVMEELSEEMKDQAVFYNADVDENMKLAEQYGIQNIPALVFLKNGEIAGRSVGFLPKEQMKEMITSSLFTD